MGQIYTLTEISEKRVPTIELFNGLVEKIKTEIQNEERFISALLCGSVANGKAGSRSDIDCVILYEDGDEMAILSGALAHLHKEARSKNIPLDFIPISMKTAYLGLHCIGPSFLDHLRISEARGGLIKDRSVVQELKPLSRSFQADALDYISHKIDATSKRAVTFSAMTEKDQARALSKILEDPIHVARKTLRAFGYLGTNDTKSSVVDTFQIHFGNLGEDLVKFQDQKNRYEIVLEQALKPVGQVDYGRCLEEIHRLYPLLLKFFHGCTSLLRK